MLLVLALPWWGRGFGFGKAAPLCLGHACSPKMFDEGMNMWVFCAERYPRISFPCEIR